MAAPSQAADRAAATAQDPSLTVTIDGWTVRFNRHLTAPERRHVADTMHDGLVHVIGHRILDEDRRAAQADAADRKGETHA